MENEERNSQNESISEDKFKRFMKMFFKITCFICIAVVIVCSLFAIKNISDEYKIADNIIRSSSGSVNFFVFIIQTIKFVIIFLGNIGNVLLNGAFVWIPYVLTNLAISTNKISKIDKKKIFKRCMIISALIVICFLLFTVLFERASIVSEYNMAKSGVKIPIHLSFWEYISIYNIDILGRIGRKIVENGIYAIALVLIVWTPYFVNRTRAIFGKAPQNEEQSIEEEKES